MNLLGIAWRNIRQRPLTSALTALSLALGVALVVATLVTGALVQQAFESGAGLGYNMIVGAKGSPLQLVLNTVYFISKPIENVGWDTYQEFLPAARRADGVDGKYAASTGVAVPTCMGDYYRSFRVVGTNADFFGRLTRGDGEPFRFAAGSNFRDDDFFAGVIGATPMTARNTIPSRWSGSSSAPGRRSTAACSSTWRASISRMVMPSRSRTVPSRRRWRPSPGMDRPHSRRRSGR
jgi:putative ABC transport system permease protein